MIDFKNYYPTPDHVIDLMLSGFDFQDKFVLEPSAGKGNILKRLFILDIKKPASIANKKVLTVKIISTIPEELKSGIKIAATIKTIKAIKPVFVVER